MRKNVGITLIAAVLLTVIFVVPLFLGRIANREIEKRVNASIKGKISIGKTYIGASRIYFENLSLKSLKGERLVEAEKIEIKFNPLKILDKPYFQRSIKSVDIDKPVINLAADEKGKWNILKIMKPKKKKLIIRAAGIFRIHSGVFNFSDPRYGGIRQSAKNLNLEAVLYPEKSVEIKSLSMQTGSASKIKASGSLNQSLNGGFVKISAKNLKAAEWVSYITHRKDIDVQKGTVNIDGSISSENIYSSEIILDALDISARAGIKKMSLKTKYLPDEIKSIDGQIFMNKNVITAENIKCRYNGSHFRLNGKLIGFENPSLGFFLSSRDVNLSSLNGQPVSSGIPYKMSGFAKADISVSGRMSKPVIRGIAAFDNIKIAGENLVNGEADFESFAKTLRFRISKAEWQGGNFKGSGFISFTEKPVRFMLDLEGDNANAGKLAAILAPGYGVSARSNFEVAVMGTAKDPVVLGKTDFYNANYNNINLKEGSGHFAYSDGDLILSDLNVNASFGSLQVPWGMIDVKNNNLNVLVTASKLVLPPGMAASLKEAGLKSDLSARVFGKISSPIAAGTFENASLSYKGSNLTGSKGGFIYGKNLIILDKVAGLLDGNRFAGSGWLRPGKNPDGEMAFSLKDFKMSQIPGLKSLSSSKKPEKTADLSGYAEGNSGIFQWGASGGGDLGSFVTFGNYKKDGLDGAILGQNFDLDGLIPPDSIDKFSPGKGSFTLTGSGKINNLKSGFIVFAPKGRLFGLPVNFGRGDFNYKNGSIKIANSYWLGYESSGAKSPLDCLSRGTSGALASSRLSLMYLTPFLLSDYSYTADGLIQNARPASETVKTAFGNRYGESPSCVKALDASISGTINPAAKLVSLNLRSERIDLETAGAKLDFKKVGLPKDEIMKYIDLFNLDGFARLSGKITGRFDSPRWDGRLSIVDGEMNGEPFSLSSKISLDKKRIEIARLRFRQSTGRYDGKGIINFKPLTYNISLNAADGKISRLLAFTPWKGIPVLGLLNGDVSLKNTGGKLQANGKVVINKAEIYGQPFSSMGVDISSGKTGINLKQMSAYIDGGEITGSGRITGDKFNLAFKSSQIPLSKITMLRQNFPDISGNGNMEVKMTGDIISPAFDMNFTADKFTIKGQYFDAVSGHVIWEKNRLALSPLTMRTAASYWNLGGTVDFPGGSIPLNWAGWSKRANPPVLDIKSDFKNIQIHKILSITNHPLQKDITGVLNGDVAISGSFPIPAFVANIQIEKGGIGETKFDKIEGLVRKEANSIRFDNVSYLSGNSNAKITGTYDQKGGTVNLETTVNNIPAAILRPFIPATSGLTGNIFANARITGKLETPDISSEIHLRNGSIDKISFDDIGGRIYSKAGLVSFDDLSIKKENRSLTFQGEIPLSLKGGKLENTGPMRISASFKQKSIDILELFIPVIKSSTGSISGSLDISGIYPNLDIKGETSINAESIALKFMENPITNLAVDAVVNGKDLAIRTFRGNLGAGTFNLNGSARLDSETFKIGFMKFFFIGNNMTIQIPGFLKGLVDARATLTGDQKRPVIGDTTPETGNDYVKIYNATLSMPGDQLKNLAQLIPGEKKKNEKKNGRKSEENGGLPAIPLPEIKNFIVTIANDVWIDYKGIFMKSSGDLKIIREPGQSLRVFGELAFSSGRISFPFLAAPLRIAEGTAYFNGGDPVIDPATKQVTDYRLNPYFDFEAETHVSEHDIYISFKGDLDQLKNAFNPKAVSSADLTMYSIPSETKDNILGMLISSTFLGTTTEAGTTINEQPVSFEGAAVSALANYLQSLLIAPITKSFGRALSLSEIYLFYTPNGYWTIQLSKALDAKERFFITYQSIKGPQNTKTELWGLEYKFRPGMRVRVENSQDTFTYSLRGQIEFNTFSEFLGEFLRAITFQRPVKPQKNGTQTKRNKNANCPI